MKKTLLASLYLLLSLSLQSQNDISIEEAKTFMETYLEECLQNKYPDAYNDYFDIDQKEEDDYLINTFFHQYRILSVQPPWVEVLASYDSPEKWDRIFSFRLKKEEGNLFIIPQKIRYWMGGNILSYQEERTISRSFSEEDITYFRNRTLVENSFEASDIDLNNANLLGNWMINECASCGTYSRYDIFENIETIRFKPKGQFGERGNWFVAEDRLFIRFPDKVTYLDFKIYPVKDSSIWILHEGDLSVDIGVHLIRKDKIKVQPTNVLHHSLFPHANILVQPIYDDLQCVMPNRIIFRTNGKKGMMDSLSNIIVPAKYDKISTATGDDMIYASTENETLVLDINGNLVKTLDFIVDFSWVNNQYFISRKDKMGTMDSLGNILIEPIYDNLKPGGFTHYMVCKKDQWGLIDLEGNEVLPIEYDGVEYRTEQLTIVQEEGHYGVVNIESGELIIAIEYDRIKIKGSPMILAYKPGMAIPHKMDGSRLLGLEYDYMEWVGWNYMGVEKNGKRGVINELGETVLPIKYDDVLWADLSLKGLFEVTMDDETMVVDSTETIISEQELERRKEVANQLYEEQREDPSGKKSETRLFPKRIGSGYALVNAEGEMVLPPIYEDYPLRTSDGHLIVDKKGFAGLIDQKGSVVLPFIFQDIYECAQSGIYIVEYQDKKGLIRI